VAGENPRKATLSFVTATTYRLRTPKGPRIGTAFSLPLSYPCGAAVEHPSLRLLIGQQPQENRRCGAAVNQA
jgi:hypothetical protein